jgi:hypothetical protein
MSKIKYLIIFSFVFLVGCSNLSESQRYDTYQSNIKEKYRSLACPFTDPYGGVSKCGLGRSDISQSEANKLALSNCKRTDCIIIKENNNMIFSMEKHKLQIEKKKLDNYTTQCEYIGFKRNTEKMGDCVLKISQTEKQIVNTQSNNSSGDTLANLIILQESLKLLQPPANPRRNVQCKYNTVGGILGVNCF